MAKPKICIDAGHSGKYNRSPAVKTYYESDMTWKLHLLLKAELEKRGFEVITTRATQNTELSVTARGKKAKGCDLFLSLHSNAPDSKVHENIDYPLVIVQLDGKGHTLGRELADCIEKTMGTKQDGRIMTKKGNNGEYYGVLRGAASVGVMGMILEHSFHTNTKATRWLLDESNLAKLAKAEADIIAAHFGIKESATPGTNTTKTCAVELPVLKRGDKGETVEAMQVLLDLRGFACGENGADGSFGPATEKALIAFQESVGLDGDGSCGPATWTALVVFK